MARIRTIKPEFWTDAKTGTLPEFSKCLFLGLLNHADDYGVLEWQPVEWRAKIFPYHSDTTTGAVQRALSGDLLERGLLVLFAFTDDAGETRRYAFIQNFCRHQVINKPSRPLLTGWKIGDTPKTYAKREGHELQEVSGSEDGVLLEPSGSAPGALLPGKERKGKERGSVDPRGSTAGIPPGGEPEVVDEDPRARLFRIGKPLLISFGIAEKRTGSLIGLWLKARPDPAGLLAAIQFARDENVADAVAYISALVNGKGKAHGKKSGADLARELAEQVRREERARDAC